MKTIKKDTNRIAKVNSLIQRELGPILHNFFRLANRINYH
jgi:hypothetical protein